MASSLKSPPRVSRNAAAAPTTRSARPRCKIARKQDTFDMSAHTHPIELLRFNTCGSVDNGKSTLIGRLLYDSKNLMEDQLEALERSADITGGGQINPPTP